MEGMKEVRQPAELH